MSILKPNSYLKFLLPALGCWLLATTYSFAQSNLRKRIIPLIKDKDTVQLDTLSIIPGTISVKWLHGDTLPPSFYQMDYINARMVWKDNSHNEVKDSMILTYKVFPFLFSQKFQHKDVKRIQNNQYGEPYVYSYDKSKETDFFKTEGLTKSGSISRGISFGNNQDVVLNSNLNLQLAGKLSENMDVLLAATDQNIPVQPEGNTQQLQEFDKVFIQLGINDLPVSGRTTVTTGDFQITKPKGYFMNFNKKLQGLGFESTVKDHKSNVFTAKASMAVSKGKFAKNVSAESSNGNTFNGSKQERNQGPYKLRGAENEQFIIVLAGTETVYLDGQLLKRGQENDYTIDYNTAEIIFTPQHLITKDKRITVEFQYSDKNYARSLIHAGTAYDTKKIKARINVFSEQDNKNKPLQQQLDKSQKLLLNSIGDSLQNALWPSGDSIAFNNTEVLYDKMDSVNGTFVYPVYVYSTDTGKAHYRLGFSFVGTNKGNYRLKQSAANGKVYEWILPDTISGQPQGSYEPVIVLITPKQKQMITAGADFTLFKNSILSIEGAESNNNINTFSNLEKKDDAGFAGKLNWDNKIILGKTDSIQKESAWKLLTNVNYEFLQKSFSPIERFRNVEFERDWNRGSTAQKEDQHIIGGRIGFAKKENAITYDYKSFLEGGLYEGKKHDVHSNLGFRGLVLTLDGSYLDSKSSFNRSNFLRNRSSISKKIDLHTGNFVLGVREQQEENLIRSKSIDSLLSGSSRFYEWEPYAELEDSSNNKYSISYKQRTDYGRSNFSNAELHKTTFAESFGGGVELFSNPNSQLRITGSYRKLNIVDPTITSQKPENTLIGRTEYNLTLLKGFFSSNTFYEVGSGLEVKREFVFIEVAAGQGTHIWKDYNSNGIKELNEFEISPFANEADYIKVWVPTDDYISTYTNQFSEIIGIRPASLWSGKNGVKKFISRFANQTAYRTDRKTTNADLAVAYNPFLSDTKDLTLIALNSSLRNTVFFNQSDPVFGADFTWQGVSNKSLLVNDTSFRTAVSRETKIRWNINNAWTLQTSYKDGSKQNNSKFFTTRNYYIVYYETEPKLSLQSGSAFRITASYKYSQKENKNTSGVTPNEKTVLQNFGGEMKFNSLNKGSLNMKANYIMASFNSPENTPIAFEMLEGLKTGENYTWSIGYSRTLANNIQLNITYDGRQSPGIKTIHTGSAQVRAYF